MPRGMAHHHDHHGGLTVTDSGRPRCTHCGRHVHRHDYTSTRNLTTGVTSYYCDHRVACRRALHAAHGTVTAHGHPTARAHGAALIAADYVDWPRWARLIPRSARDDLARRFALRMAAAVERQFTTTPTSETGADHA